MAISSGVRRFLVQLRIEALIFEGGPLVHIQGREQGVKVSSFEFMTPACSSGGGWKKDRRPLLVLGCQDQPRRRFDHGQA
jgi:hypothetical protein